MIIKHHHLFIDNLKQKKRDSLVQVDNSVSVHPPSENGVVVANPSATAHNSNKEYEKRKTFNDIMNKDGAASSQRSIKGKQNGGVGAATTAHDIPGGGTASA